MKYINTNCISRIIKKLAPNMVMANVSKFFHVVMRFMKDAMKQHEMVERKSGATHTDEWKAWKAEQARNQKRVRYNYTITSPEGIVFNTDNMKEFCREYKLHQPSMVDTCTGTNKYRGAGYPGYKGFTVTRTAK